MLTTNETWMIEVQKKGSEESFQFRRYTDGKINESYAPVGKELALLYASHILLGLEPPRKFIHLHSPSR